MGCNCKKQVNFINQKFGDGQQQKVTPLQKILNFFAQIFFGILCAVIIIIMAIPMLIYIIICVIFGKQANFKVKNLNKYLNKE